MIVAVLEEQPGSLKKLPVPTPHKETAVFERTGVGIQPASLVTIKVEHALTEIVEGPDKVMS